MLVLLARALHARFGAGPRRTHAITHRTTATRTPEGKHSHNNAYDRHYYNNIPAFSFLQATLCPVVPMLSFLSPPLITAAS